MRSLKTLYILAFIIFLNSVILADNEKILEYFYKNNLLTSTKQLVFEKNFNVNDPLILYFIAEDIHLNIMNIKLNDYVIGNISKKTIKLIYMFMYINKYFKGTELVYNFLLKIKTYEKKQFNEWKNYLKEISPYVSEKEEKEKIPKLINIIKKHEQVKKELQFLILIKTANIFKYLKYNCDERKKIYSIFKNKTAELLNNNKEKVKL